MEETIVKEWLRSLKMGQYTESFIDNGYDDLEICKQIDAPDLDAIGVVDPLHRIKIQQAVQTLRVEGAASVYFTVEEVQASRLETPSRNSDPGPYQDIKKPELKGTGSAASTPCESSRCISDLTTSDDAYEAGRAELVRLPQIQLRTLLKDNLDKDRVNLTIHPYTSKEGERGVLEGLASRYADRLNTHYQDVLEHLEYLRSQDWNKVAASLKIKVISPSNGHLYSQQPDPCTQLLDSWSPRSSSSSSLDHHDDHPIYLPGKYNPSSCLSDAEEDQIYGFTGMFQPSTSAPAPGMCLNPRSQSIYEHPPVRVGRHGHGTVKKRLGLGRLLKTLKRDLRRTSDAKVKSYLPRTLNVPQRPLPGTTPDLSSTPLVVLPGYSSPTTSHCSQSSKSHSSEQSCIVASSSAPGTPGSSGPIRDSGLQQAIEKLKVQEIQRRREEQFREHEQVLHDLRQGLEQTKNNLQGITNTYAPISTCYDASYIFDEESELTNVVRRRGCPPANILFQHWYDEPPYESDPEDFLIGKENSRESSLCSQMRLSRDEDVISKTAGDISIPRDLLSDWSTPRHQSYPCQISPSAIPPELPPRVLPPTTTSSYLPNGDKNPHSILLHGENIRYNLIKPVNNRANAVNYSYPDRSEADVQRVSTRISSMTVNNRPRGDCANDDIRPVTSSEYEDNEKRDSASLVGRMRVLHRDMQKKISRLRNVRETNSFEGEEGPPPRQSNSSSIRPDFQTVYSCYQRQSSLPVKLKQELRSPTQVLDVRERASLPVIGRARALADYTPSPYDKDVLSFKKGDMIDILGKSPSGLWKGHLRGRVGHFKFILVEEEIDPRLSYATCYRFPQTYQRCPWNQKPESLQSLLADFHLSHLTQVFLLNGYETLDQFRDLMPEDLDHLGIVDTETRAKLLAAVGMILDSEEAAGDLLEPSFVRHSNGRITLPAASASASASSNFVAPSFPPYQTTPEAAHYPVVEGSPCQMYENAPYLRVRDENNLDCRRSPPSADNSGHHTTRPPFNIPLVRSPASSAFAPLGAGGVAFSPSSSSASTPHSTHGILNLVSRHSPPQQETLPSESSSPAGAVATATSAADSQQGSYRAQVVRVDSSPPVSSPAESILHLKSTTC